MTIVISILGLGLLIFVHELGHYLAARLVGVSVETFSIGFGPKLYSWTSGETRYQLALLPLGGFVKIKGLIPKNLDKTHTRIKQTSSFEKEWMMGTSANELYDQDNTVEPDSYLAKGLWARTLIVGAGPLFNVLFTLFIFWLSFHFQASQSFDYLPSPTLRISEVKGAAHNAGIQVGDHLIKVNGESIERFAQLRKVIQIHGASPITLTIARPPSDATLQWSALSLQKQCEVQLKQYQQQKDASTSLSYQKSQSLCEHYSGVLEWSPLFESHWPQHTFTIQPEEIAPNLYKVGISPDLARYGGDGIIRSFTLAFGETSKALERLWITLAGGLRSPSELEVASVVKITAVSADTVKKGPSLFIHFLGFLSLNLALINLLPLPALDGGRLIFIMIEAIIRRPVPPNLELITHVIGALFIIGITLWVLTRDIVALM